MRTRNTAVNQADIPLWNYLHSLEIFLTFLVLKKQGAGGDGNLLFKRVNYSEKAKIIKICQHNQISFQFCL